MIRYERSKVDGAWYSYNTSITGVKTWKEANGNHRASVHQFGDATRSFQGNGKTRKQAVEAALKAAGNPELGLV